MNRNLVLELDVPSSAEYIAIVRLVVASVASSRRNLADERVDDLKLAVSEACTNAIEANRLVHPEATVHVEIWEAPDRMEVCIEDYGPGFDPDKLEFPPPVTDPERLNFERGLGIPLIRTLVDNVVFVGRGAGDGEGGANGERQHEGKFEGKAREKGTSVRMTVFGGPMDGDDTGAIYMDVSTLSSLPPLPEQA